MMIIQSKRIWIQEQWVASQLEIHEQKITHIWPYETKPVDIDYSNHRVYPGFIDTHCHGAFGFDTNDGNEAGMRLWLNRAPEEGVTLLCPTTITQSEEILTKALQTVSNVMKTETTGAQIGGIHFEGPYLNTKFKGAQPEKFILKPDIQQFKRYELASQNTIRIVTLAPENDENHEFIDYLVSKGIAAHIGHSGATYQESLFALANGASGFTHTFNGMSPFNHREPGATGASLQIRNAYSELICDGIHVSWPAVNILFGLKGKDYVVLVTDALQAKGVGEGSYVFGGQSIEIRSNGGAYLAGTNNLAGSTLKMNESVRNAIIYAGADEASVINGATLNPARVLKIDDQKGKIQTGYDADLTILDDLYEVVEVFVLGNSVYKRKH